jgi:FK506-binding protein 4/5
MTYLFVLMHLLSCAQEKPFWKMDTKEKIEACERNKNDGNELFKAGMIWRASRKYDKESSCDRKMHLV